MENKYKFYYDIDGKLKQSFGKRKIRVTRKCIICPKISKIIIKDKCSNCYQKEFNRKKTVDRVFNSTNNRDK